MLTLKQAEKNILAVASESTKEHWAKGKEWYYEAHKFCKSVAKTHSYSLEQVVGILAALSPQCSWEINKRETEALIATGDTIGYTGYKNNVRKAQNIREGMPVSMVLGTSLRYGHKVRAFYFNVLDPSAMEQVTIDTHAARAAFNKAELNRAVIKWVFTSAGNKVLQEAYKNAAKHYKATPCAFQATVWLTVKSSLNNGG